MLGEDNLRQTKQRKTLLDILYKKGKPMTAEQVMRACQQNCPNIAITTVYRNLEKLIELGYVERRKEGSGATRYAIDIDRFSEETGAETETVYLICRECRKRIPVSTAALGHLETSIEEKLGFHVEHASVEMYGICSRCCKKC